MKTLSQLTCIIFMIVLVGLAEIAEFSEPLNNFLRSFSNQFPQKFLKELQHRNPKVWTQLNWTIRQIIATNEIDKINDSNTNNQTLVLVHETEMWFWSETTTEQFLREFQSQFPPKFLKELQHRSPKVWTQLDWTIGQIIATNEIAKIDDFNTNNQPWFWSQITTEWFLRKFQSQYPPKFLQDYCIEN